MFKLRNVSLFGFSVRLDRRTSCWILCDLVILAWRLRGDHGQQGSCTTNERFACYVFGFLLLLFKERFDLFFFLIVDLMTSVNNAQVTKLVTTTQNDPICLKPTH